MFLGSKVRPVHRAENFATICVPIVYTIFFINISQPYRPPRLVTGIALLLLYCFYVSVLYYFSVRLNGEDWKKFKDESWRVDYQKFTQILIQHV
jgi:hypothetical protein